MLLCIYGFLFLWLTRCDIVTIVFYDDYPEIDIAGTAWGTQTSGQNPLLSKLQFCTLALAVLLV